MARLRARAESSDRLSELPEPILCHILSFLPIKTVVTCSVLSKRWQFLWTRVAVVDFFQSPRTLPPDGGEGSYYKFLQKILLRTDFPIKKLRGVRFRYDSDVEDIVKWISPAVSGGAEELDLRYGFAGRPLPIRMLFSGNNLTTLKLSCLPLDTLQSFHFPRLQVLHLDFVQFVSSLEMENFISSCPVLKELVVKHSFDDLCDVRICVPTLISLVVEFDNEERDDYNHPLILETPALEYLSFKHCGSNGFRVGGGELFNLVEAHIFCRVPEGVVADNFYLSCVMELLTKLSSVKFLNLCWSATTEIDSSTHKPIHGQGLVHSLDHYSSKDLPVFHNLIRLELHIPICDYVVLPYLLEKFHSLKSIIVEKGKIRADTVRKVPWKEPMQVPICLSSHLLSFCFRGYHGFELEAELVKYIMKNAMVLRNVTLKGRSRWVSEILMAPMISKGCQIQII